MTRLAKLFALGIPLMVVALLGIITSCLADLFVFLENKLQRLFSDLWLGVPDAASTPSTKSTPSTPYTWHDL